MKQESVIVKRKHSKSETRCIGTGIVSEIPTNQQTRCGGSICRRQPICVRNHRTYCFWCKPGWCRCLGGLLRAPAPGDLHSSSCTRPWRPTAATACETVLNQEQSLLGWGFWRAARNWTGGSSTAPSKQLPTLFNLRGEAASRTSLHLRQRSQGPWLSSCPDRQVVRAAYSLGFSAPSRPPLRSCCSGVFTKEREKIVSKYKPHLKWLKPKKKKGRK